MSDIIDINVNETIEEVTINVTDNLITVNINKVTGGGGGTQTLAQTLVLGNITDGENISISNGDAIILDNGSMLKKGTIDAGNGGAKGISQICSVGYEHKWEAGRLYIMNDGGTTIREVSHNFTNVPTATDDVTKGFVQNTRWILDNGDVYLCTDPTEDAAVWELQVSSQVNADWDATSGVAEILNKPTIPSITNLVPYTGATADVNLGEFGLLTGNLEFDNTPTNIPTAAGSMYYNDTDGTLDLILKGGNVKLQIGQEQLVRVVNKTATNINLLEANYQAVRVTGAQGQRIKVDLAQASSEALSAETIGLVTETINNNQEGFVTTSGLIRNINTTGSLQGETWIDGDILYLSPTTAGNITNIKPTGANHLIIIGYVIHSHATQGTIFVKVDNGYEISELHDVDITSVANNQLLSYDSVTSLWKNKSVTTADIAASTNKNYVTDAQATVIGNTSGTNTGDNSVNTNSNSYADAKVADSITDGVTTIAPSQNAVFDALALKQAALSYTPYRNVQTSQTALTGTTAETVIFTATIPANAFNSNDVIKVLFGANKTLGLGSYSLRIRVNTTNTIAGAPTIALYNGTLTAQVVIMMRNFSLNGGNLYGIGGGNSAITDIVALGGSLGSTTLNPANQFFLFATITLNNSGDSIIGNMFTIHN